MEDVAVIVDDILAYAKTYNSPVYVNNFPVIVALRQKELHGEYRLIGSLDSTLMVQYLGPKIRMI